MKFSALNFNRAGDGRKTAQRSSPSDELFSNKRNASHGFEILVAIVIVLVALRYYFLGVSMLIPSLAASILIAAWIARDISEHARWKRTMLLKSYRQEFRRGESVILNGELLRYDTELTTYVLCVGMILTDIRILSNYTLSKESLPSIALLYSFGSILLGWFSLFGPFTTLQSVIVNVRGNHRESVAMIIDHSRFKQFLAEEIARLEDEELNRNADKR